MFIPTNTSLTQNRINSDIANSEADFLSENIEIFADNIDVNPVRLKHVTMKYTKEIGFFKGMFLAMPLSILLWATIIWAAKSLFF